MPAIQCSRTGAQCQILQYSFLRNTLIWTGMFHSKVKNEESRYKILKLESVSMTLWKGLVVAASKINTSYTSRVLNIPKSLVGMKVSEIFYTSNFNWNMVSQWYEYFTSKTYILWLLFLYSINKFVNSTELINKN